MENIPAEGGCVIVCNHPFGAIDGLALIQQIEKRRPDIKVMANFLLEEIPEIAKLYPTWKNNDVEVLLVSLDENEMDFINFASVFPFISVCDYQKWNSPIAQNYYVFGTPTMYLLDKNRKIILRPNSVKQMDAWVDWYLVKANAINQN